VALRPRFATLAVNTKVNAQGVLLNAGYLDIYDGTQPATANTAITTQVRLARLTFGSPAFASAVAGVAAANPITSDVTASATGTASWFRAVQADGVTVVYDGSVDTADANLNLTSVAIAGGASVSVTSFTMTEL
jgi:hypothetical protein